MQSKGKQVRMGGVTDGKGQRLVGGGGWGGGGDQSNRCDQNECEKMWKTFGGINKGKSPGKGDTNWKKEHKGLSAEDVSLIT